MKKIFDYFPDFSRFCAVSSAMASRPLRIGFRGGVAVNTYSLDRITVNDTEIKARALRAWVIRSESPLV
ncbi:MAG: hypothetical protein L6V35_03900 [Alistipes putredinis]|nr:MAG: hypothetical protein L6V35_03900 [Alistipes putredinis]